ncbi:MAG: hypothetical protein OHK0039_17980 [Bacteroidia bacterium]
MHTRAYATLLLILGLAFQACEPSTQQETPEDADTLSIDSIVYEEMRERGLATIAPELIGVWQLEEMRLDDTPMSVGDVGENFLEFRADGLRIATSPGTSPDTSAFVYEDNTIRTELDENLRIEEISSTRLVLSTTLDNTTVRYIYKRN